MHEFNDHFVYNRPNGEYGLSQVWPIKVNKALYGLMRAGDDYDRYARKEEEKLGWQSLRPVGHPAFATRRL